MDSVSVLFISFSVEKECAMILDSPTIFDFLGRIADAVGVLDGVIAVLKFLFPLYKKTQKLGMCLVR